MNSSILFGDSEVESFTIDSEVFFFEYEPPVGDLLCQSLWSVGDDEEQDDLMSELGIYNIQQKVLCVQL